MPIRGIDFSKFSLKEALDLAIVVEEEARDRYLELVEQMKQFRTPDAAALFEKMARDEELHRTELVRQRRTEIFGQEPSAITRSMIFDVEAPEYDEARAFMTQREAVAVALKSELKAQEFFLGLVEKVNDPEVRELFEELAREEQYHQTLLRAELARLPEDAQLPDDEGDEPVAL